MIKRQVLDGQQIRKAEHRQAQNGKGQGTLYGTLKILVCPADVNDTLLVSISYFWIDNVAQHNLYPLSQVCNIILDFPISIQTLNCSICLLSLWQIYIYSTQLSNLGTLNTETQPLN